MSLSSTHSASSLLAAVNFLYFNIRLILKITIMAHTRTDHGLGTEWIQNIDNYLLLDWLKDHLDYYSVLPRLLQMYFPLILTSNLLSNASIAILRYYLPPLLSRLEYQVAALLSVFPASNSFELRPRRLRTQASLGMSKLSRGRWRFAAIEDHGF